MVAAAMKGAAGPWWIIAGAAAALHGVEGEVGDVDVLLDVADARVLLPRLGLIPEPGGESALFRSAVFARWTRPPLPVEFMADFACRVDGVWRSVSPATRVVVTAHGARVYIPERQELAALFRTFGRPKDLVRATRLDAPTS